jgi:hypothetical protein
MSYQSEIDALPVKQWQEVTIKKGARIKTTRSSHKEFLAKKTYKVIVRSVSIGFSHPDYESTSNPSIT